MQKRHSFPIPCAAVRRIPIPSAAVLCAAILLLSVAAPLAQTPRTGPTTNEPPSRAVGVVASAANLPHAEENWLVAVGVNRFQDPTVNPLRFCAADAADVHAFFTASGLVPSDRAYLLVTDAPESRNRPTRINILKTVQYAADHAGANSTIVLFFGAHGFVDRDGMSYVLPEDGDSAMLRDTGVSIARVNEILRDSASKRKVVFMDACRNAPFADAKGTKVEGRPSAQSDAFLETLKSAEGQVTLAACAKGQSSFEDASAGHGVFTRYLLDGLRGGARPDERGLISVVALQEYLSRAVPAWSRETRNPPQNPWMWGKMSVPIPLAVAGREEFVVPPSGGRTQKPPEGGTTNLPPIVAQPPSAAPAGKSGVAARLALDELMAALEKREYPPEKRIAYYQDFSKEWSGTSAADEARQKVASLQNLQRLLEEAKTAYQTLDAREKQEVLTQSQADSRRTAWDGYVSKYSDTGFQVAEAQKKASYYQTWRPGPRHKDVESFDLGDGVKLEMVYLEGGTFQMGSPDSEESHQSNEIPVHAIVLDGFSMGKYEVTQEQYQAIMGSNPSSFKDGKNPVECVSWNDATDFCRKLSQKTGKTFRLPTEAEWEYACRAGSRTRFCFGDSDNGLGDYAWYDGNSGSTTHPVGEKQPNAWGLYDMHGNVWEWCSDWYADKYGAGAEKNPAGASSGQYRVLRGGSWHGNPRSCRSAIRLGHDPTHTNVSYGFRVVSFSGGL